MFSKIIAVAALAVAVCSAQSHGGHHGGESYINLSGGTHGHEQVVHIHSHPKYEFKYGIEDSHTKDHHQQHEVRDGDVVKGEYSLHEPDGTIRIVKYTADHKNGFNAQVIRQGHAAHPQNTHKSTFVVPVQHYGGGGGGAGGLGGGHGHY